MALRPGKYRLGSPSLTIDKEGVGSIQYPVYGLNVSIQVPVDIPMDEWEQVRAHISQYLTLKYTPSIRDKYLAAVANRTTGWMDFLDGPAGDRGSTILWEKLYDDVDAVVLIDGYWKCPDSPTNKCQYRPSDGPMDFCIHCGSPHERK